MGRIAAAIAGFALVALIAESAVRTFVVPRAYVSPLTRVVFTSMRALFNLRLRFLDTYEERDRLMALYAPITLLVLPAVWLLAVFFAFALFFWATGMNGFHVCLELSGSSLLTLGFVSPPGFWTMMLSFAEAAIGLALLALLIAYLPTIYSAFSRREVQVAQLAVRSGTPPSGADLLIRAHRMERFHLLDELWAEWQTWFAELEETHTSLAVLNFFRSPRADRSWVTSAGAVLDAASLLNSTVDAGWSPQAGACIRSGYLALDGIADFFDIPHDVDPLPTDPISIAQSEFDEVYDRLAEAGVAVRPDREQAWRDFAGWRVNYDSALVSIAGLVMAPYAPWSSDRSMRYRRPRVTRRHRGRTRAGHD